MPPSKSRPLASLQIDPRYFQVAVLGGLLAFGLLFLGWQTRWPSFMLLMVLGVGMQLLAIQALGLPRSSLLSGLISSLSLCLLFRFSGLEWALLAAGLTIGSKYLLRIGGQHFFNPTNFGIVATGLLAGHDAWVSPGQWGENFLFAAFLALAASVVLFRVGRWDTALAFLLSYAAIELLYNSFYLGWPLDFTGHKLLSGSLLIFTFFMITDPKTTPNHRWARIPWAMALAGLTFYLSTYHYRYDAPLLALFAVSFLNPILNRFLKKPSFQWPSLSSSA